MWQCWSQPREAGHVLRGEEKQGPEGPEEPVAAPQGRQSRGAQGGVAAGPQDGRQGELQLGAVGGEAHGPATAQGPHQGALEGGGGCRNRVNKREAGTTLCFDVWIQVFNRPGVAGAVL